MEKKHLVIFDLDGTLADTSKGIYECYKFALKSLGRKEPTYESLDGVIGGSLLKNFETKFDLTLDEAKEAVRIYREHYAKVGYKDSTLYDGMKEALLYLKHKGYKIAVATLKAEYLAIELFKELGILDLFDLVHGVDKNDTLTKTMLVDMCISECGADIDSSVLVGDSNNDATGAKQSNIDFVAATYGFGFKTDKDLECVEHIAIISKPSDLKNIF